MNKNRWKYHAAMRRKEQKLRDFAEMYGPSPSTAWAITPTDRVTMGSTRKPSPVWQALYGGDQTLATADYSAIEQRILATMPMSRDRVRFTIDTFTDDATRKAFQSAFGVPLVPKLGPYTHLTVVCRPSQFARFLIHRNDNGGRNSFKELAPTLFTPQPQMSELDVSGNPAS
jgi:hypothetical protein